MSPIHYEKFNILLSFTRAETKNLNFHLVILHVNATLCTKMTVKKALVLSLVVMASLLKESL